MMMGHEFEEEERTPLKDENRKSYYYAPAIDDINSESIRKDQLYFIV